MYVWAPKEAFWMPLGDGMGVVTSPYFINLEL